MSKKAVCQYFLNGYCKFGDKCKYSHNIKDDIDMNPPNQHKFPTQKNNTCTFFLKNKCTKSGCTYFHGYFDKLQHVKTITNHSNEINNLVIMDNTKFISSDTQTFYVRFSGNDEFHAETINQDHKIGKLIYSSNKVICAIQSTGM